MPYISVVMSVFNEEKNITKCIESVMRQSFKNYEFLIFDDNSNDSTKKILKKFIKKNKKIKCHFSKKNLGLTKALNFLIKKSKGKYIARIDGDDLWLKHKLQIQLDFMKKNKIFLVGTNGYYKKKNKIFRKSNLPLSFDNIKNKIFYFNPIIHSSVLFRNDKKSKFYDENFTKCQDYNTWVRCIFKNKKIQNLPNYLVEHNIDKNYDILTLINTFKIKLFIFRKINKISYLFHLFWWTLINFVKFIFNVK